MNISFASKALTAPARPRGIDEAGGEVARKAQRTQRECKIHFNLPLVLVASTLLLSCSGRETYDKFIRNAAEGNFTIVSTLFERGRVPHVNVRDSLGNTALMMAAKNGHGEIVRYLLSKGADLLLTNRNGDTALTLALKAGHGEIVSFLRPKPAVL